MHFRAGGTVLRGASALVREGTRRALQIGVIGSGNSLVISERNQVAPDGDLWMSVLEQTSQPADMR